MNPFSRAHAPAQVPSHARAASKQEGGGRTDGRTDSNPIAAAASDLARQAGHLGLQMAWRYRRELAPVWAAIGLAILMGAAHEANPAGAPLALLAGLAVTGAAWAVVRNPADKQLALYVGIGASLWAAGAWWFGPLARVCACAWAIGTLSVTVAWLRRGRRGSGRQRIEVIGGTWRPWEREGYAYTRRVTAALRRIDDAWPRTIADAGLDPGFQLRRLIGDRWCYSLHIEIPSGHILDELHKARGALETALDADRATTSIEGEQRARGAVIRWTYAGKERPDLLWPGPSGTRLAHPIVLGEYEDRTPLAITLGLTGPDAHAFVTGATGAGKTTLLRLLTGELVAREDVVVWGVDMAKVGTHFLAWGDCLDRLVREPADVLPMLRAVNRLIRARARWLGEHGHDDWPTSRERPHLVVVIDELSEVVLRVRGAVRELESIARIGRQLGVTLLLSTQRSTDDALGDSSLLRSQVRLRIALNGDSRDARATFDQGLTASAGWDPGALPARGWVLVCSSAHPSPRQARTFHLTREMAVAEAAVRRGNRPRWDEISASAILGDAAEEPVAEVGPRLLAMPAVDDRLPRLWAAIEEAGAEEFSGNRLKRPGLDKNWISKDGLPHFAAQGLIERTPSQRWRRAGQARVSEEST